MKNKILFALFTTALAIPFALSAKGSPAEVKAVGEHGEEAAVESIWVDRLPATSFHGQQWLTERSADGVITMANNAGKYVFDLPLQNIEVQGNYGFSAVNWNYWFSINLGATYDATDIFASKGYAFVFDMYGKVELKKNDVKLTEATNAAFTINTTDTFKYAVSSRNCGDGSVRLMVKVNDTLLLDYYDEESPIVSGCVGGETFYAACSIYSECDNEVLNLPEYDDAMGSDDSGVSEIKDNGCEVTTAASTGSGFSGVGFTHALHSKGYAFNTMVTPLSDSTTLAFQVGAINGAINATNHKVCSLGTIDATWGWERGGYVLWLLSSGQLLLSHQWYNNDVITTSWIGGLTKDASYEIEFGVESYSFGNIIKLYIGGVCSFSYTDTTNPISFVSDGTVNYVSGVYTQTSSAKFEFEKKYLNYNGDEILLRHRKFLNDSRFAGDYETVSYSVTNLSGEAILDETTGRIIASKIGMFKAVVTVDGVPSSEHYFLVVSENPGDTGALQAIAWAVYFVEATRTADVCLAADDAAKLAGLQAKWAEFAGSYLNLPLESKQLFCTSPHADIATARNHYLFILNKFGASNLGVDGAFVTDGANPLSSANFGIERNITKTSNTYVIIICVSVVTLSALALVLVIKKRKHQ